MSITRFGPSGNDERFYNDGNKASVQAPAWLAARGLDLYEYSFGNGITVSDKTVAEIGAEAKKHGIEISVHSPYFISLASLNPETVENSYGYIIRSLKKLELFGGRNLVVHLASVGKQSREEAVLKTKQNLDTLLQKVADENLSHLNICPETMGKSMQIGTVDEIIDFCTQGANLVPTFDFGHINSLEQGSLKTKANFLHVFERALNKLGEEKVKNCHIHFSKIQYGPKGEIKHLTLEDTEFGPNFEPLAEAILQLKLAPTIICESKNIMADDALRLKQMFNNVQSILR